MKKFKNAGELMWLFGTVFVALGVSICSKANLGVSMIAAPAFVLHDTLSYISVGVLEYIFQGVLLIIMCFIIGRFKLKYLLAFAVAVIYGYTLNLFLFLLKDVVFEALWLRWVMLIVGDCITALGVASFFRTYLPLQVYELFVDEVAKRFNLSTGVTKWVFDGVLLIISIGMVLIFFGNELDISSLGYKSFHSIGLGTIVTTLINSPIITLMGNLLDKMFGKGAKFKTLEKYLSR